jgi:putative peptidoglycan lipid II flippase
LLPLLSRQVRTGEREAALHSQNRALEFAIFLMLPAAAALIVLAQPIIDVLFRRGEFGPAEVEQTAAALAAFALGLPALMLVKSLTPGFFAREDTKTPVKIAVLTAILNIGLAALLMVPLRHVGIALAASMANWVNALLLAAILRRRGFLRFDARFRWRVPRTLLATAGMAVALFTLMGLLQHWLSGSFIERAGALSLLIGSGLASFAALAHLSGAAKLGELKTLLRRGRAIA